MNFLNITKHSFGFIGNILMNAGCRVCQLQASNGLHITGKSVYILQRKSNCGQNYEISEWMVALLHMLCFRCKLYLPVLSRNKTSPIRWHTQWSSFISNMQRIDRCKITFSHSYVVSLGAIFIMRAMLQATGHFISQWTIWLVVPRSISGRPISIQRCFLTGAAVFRPFDSGVTAQQGTSKLCAIARRRKS